MRSTLKTTLLGLAFVIAIVVLAALVTLGFLYLWKVILLGITAGVFVFVCWLVGTAIEAERDAQQLLNAYEAEQRQWEESLR